MSSHGDAAPRRPARAGPVHLGRSVVVAAVLGVVGALVTVAFIKVLDRFTDLLWKDVPDWLGVGPTASAYVLAATAVGGVLVGLCRAHLGEWPKSLEVALDRFKRDRDFDTAHLPHAAVTSLVSLGFGAALGPEAALVALVGGLGTWIGRVVTSNALAEESITYVGIAGALGALFGTAGAAALAFVDPDVGRKPRRILLLLPGLAAAGAGIYIFRAFSSGNGYFDYSFPPYDLAAVDLAWGLLATLAGFAVAVVFLVGDHVVGRVVAPLRRRPVLESLVGGVVLGLLASASALVLFSGHTGIQTLVDDTDASTGYLVGISLAKVAAMSILLTTGWKGGRFFPIMFAGAAAGLALSSAVSDVHVMVGLAAAMTAAVAAVIRKPWAAALLMVFVFPPDLYPTVVIAALLAAAAGDRLVARVAFLEPFE